MQRSLYLMLLPLLGHLLPQALAGLSRVELEGQQPAPEGAADELADALRTAELEDLARMLGRRPESLEEGHVALEARIEAADADDDAPLLVHFARVGARALHLWPVLAPVAYKPLEVVAEE